MTDFILQQPEPGKYGTGQWVHPLKTTRNFLETWLNNTIFLKYCYRGYEKGNFGNAIPKTGDTFLVRAPLYVKSYSGGPSIDLSKANQATERLIPVTLDYWWWTLFECSTGDMYLYLDDWNREFMIPAGERGANDMDRYAMSMYTEAYFQVGEPGTALDSIFPFAMAKKMLDDGGVPQGSRRHVITDTTTQAYLGEGLRGLFNPQMLVGKQYEDGVLGNAQGFTFEMSQNIYTHTNGDFTADTGGLKLRYGMQNGSAQFNIYNFASSTPTVNVGDVFTVGGVNRVNMMNQQDLGYLQKFSVQSSHWDASSEVMTVNVNPEPIFDTDSAYRNISAGGLADAPVVFDGDPEQSYTVCLAFHEDAMSFVSAQLPIPREAKYAAEESMSGVNARIIGWYEPQDDIVYNRMDMLVGKKLTRPSGMVRIAC